MKKTILSICTMGIVSILLTGCCLSHEWKEATCTTPKICVKCEKTEGEALGHEWQEATCTEPKTCSVCGETEGEALGHEWKEATCTEAKTCSVCGETEGKALGHKWQEATCTEPKTCSVCGETEGEASGHEWQEATCTKAKTCSVCGETEGEALGHVVNALNICNICGEYTGDGIAYTYDNGVLTIFGKGKLTETAWNTARETYGEIGVYEELVISGNITGIGSYFLDIRGSAPHISPLKRITIEDSVTGSIEEGAFQQQDNLTEVYIGNGIESIGQDAFGCSSASYLQNVYIGDKCTTISRFAFANCQNISSFSVPSNCKFDITGDNSVFFGCREKPTVTYRK